MPQSQTDKSLRPMVMPDVINNQIAQNRFAYFQKMKRNRIKEALQGQIPDDFIRYRTIPFLGLLSKIAGTNDSTGLKVYFACYTASGNNQINEERIPKGRLGHLTMVFATTKDDGATTDLADNGDYYIFNAENGTPVDGNFATISKDDAILWINAFQQGGMLGRLNSDMGLMGDTKSIWYRNENINIAIKGISPYSSTLPHVTAFFSAYDKKYDTVDLGKYEGGLSSIYVYNQLGLIFGTGDTPMIYDKIIETSVDYDTGAPCPPATGCIASPLF